MFFQLKFVPYAKLLMLYYYIHLLFVSALYLYRKPLSLLRAATYDSATKLFDYATYYTVVTSMKRMYTFWLYTYNSLTGSGSKLGNGCYRKSVQSFPTAQFLGVSFALGIPPLP